MIKGVLGRSSVLVRTQLVPCLRALSHSGHHPDLWEAKSQHNTLRNHQQLLIASFVWKWWLLTLWEIRQPLFKKVFKKQWIKCYDCKFMMKVSPILLGGTIHRIRGLARHLQWQPLETARLPVMRTWSSPNTPLLRQPSPPSQRPECWIQTWDLPDLVHTGITVSLRVQAGKMYFSKQHNWRAFNEGITRSLCTGSRGNDKGWPGPRALASPGSKATAQAEGTKDRHDVPASAPPTLCPSHPSAGLHLELKAQEAVNVVHSGRPPGSEPGAEVGGRFWGNRLLTALYTLLDSLTFRLPFTSLPRGIFFLCPCKQAGPYGVFRE